MTIELPDIKIGDEPLTSQQARIELACALYAQWKISMKQAVDIAAMPRIFFWEELGKRKIPWQFTPEDLEHDLQVLKELNAEKVAA